MKRPESEIIKLFREAYEPCAREGAENPRKVSRQSDVSREKELREAVKEARRRCRENDPRALRELARWQKPPLPNSSLKDSVTLSWG